MNTLHSRINLDKVLVGKITGQFYIPSYQRGYRWGTDEVKRLLDDIYQNEEKDYYLQPVVVRNDGEKYELIDGQQRLTTLYLIYKYMHESSGGFLDAPKFSLDYQTRDKSQAFLNDLDVSRKEENIDFWFFSNAYETIEKWFSEKDKKSTLTNINKAFDENVKIIWYEVSGDDTQAIELFKRLNIGKIPLTSAELVKAMFLTDANLDTSGKQGALNQKLQEAKQNEIAMQWDTIERELHNESFWRFLTNSATDNYKTRIDLILDLMAEKPQNNREKYYTFFYFDQCRNTGSLDVVWKEIQHTFLLLKDWYEDHELYHKIGYLIAAETNITLAKIFQLSKGKTKTEFKSDLDNLIRESIAIGSNYGELDYLRNKREITRLLLLFNVESVRQIDKKTRRFPFYQYKSFVSGKVVWSLEHIHAQHSEGLKTQEQWKTWLQNHLASIKTVRKEKVELISEMEEAIDNNNLTGEEFKKIHEKVVVALSEKGDLKMHCIANLALLNTADNAALNNATFDVKRNEIIQMDKEGRYIPFCTKMVFLKYYTPSESNQLNFWGKADRDAYIDNINRVLKEYLAEKIVVVDDYAEEEGI